MIHCLCVEIIPWDFWSSLFTSKLLVFSHCIPWHECKLLYRNCHVWVFVRKSLQEGHKCFLFKNTKDPIRHCIHCLLVHVSRRKWTFHQPWNDFSLLLSYHYCIYAIHASFVDCFMHIRDHLCESRIYFERNWLRFFIKVVSR